MADAQANKNVYKRMSAKLGGADNGTGGISPGSNTPGGTYKRKSANTSSGASNYNRKVAKNTP